MPFLINGSTASLAPYAQQWMDVPLGVNLAGKTIYSPRKNVKLTFDDCALTDFKQWEDVVNGGSVSTLTILAPDSAAFAAYSGVYLDFDERPTVESAVATGPWTILVREVTT